MLVYFIFYDDYDLFNAENDHQNVIHLSRSKSSLSDVASLNEDEENNQEEKNKEKDRCALCLDEIICPNQESKHVFGITRKICEPPLLKDFVFRDLTLYNYDNSEYTHTCDCRPKLHCVCFINIYEAQRSCIICKKAIKWRFSKIEDAKESFCNFLFVTFYHRVYVILNMLFFAYMLIVVVHNTYVAFTSIQAFADD